jgi:hypothetical protein
LLQTLTLLTTLSIPWLAQAVEQEVATNAVKIGTYEGVWTNRLMREQGSYFLVRQNQNKLVVVFLQSDIRLPCQTFVGSISGNTASLQNITPQLGEITVKIELFSPDTAQFTVTACTPTPDLVCVFPIGIPIKVNKIPDCACGL